MEDPSAFFRKIFSQETFFPEDISRNMPGATLKLSWKLSITIIYPNILYWQDEF